MTLSRTRIVTLALLQALCGVALLSHVAVAQEKGKTKATAGGAPATQKVLGLRIEGFDLSAKDSEALFKVVQKRLKAYPSIELVRPPDAELTDLMIDLGCLDIDAECLTMVGRKQLVDRVFYAQVDAADGDAFALIIRVINVTKGVAERDRKVDVAKQADLLGALEREIVAAFGEPPPPPPKKGRLIIEADAGAKIYIAGRQVGIGRVALKRPPGLYVVRIEKPGFENALFKVDLEAGKTARKVAELKPIAPKVAKKPEPTKDDAVQAIDLEAADDEAGPAFYETWWFWTIVGVTAATATTIGVVAGSASGDPPVGDLQISVDPAAAWRDISIRAGRAR